MVEYFIMRQDARIKRAAQPLGEEARLLQQMPRSEIRGISTTLVFYVDESGRIEYPDFIESPLSLVSGMLKDIMGAYQKESAFKTVVLIERSNNRQETYYLTAPPLVECLSPATVYDARKSVKEPVLDKEKVGHARIFCAKGCPKLILARLDAAESILRRCPDGVWFEKVRIE